MENEIKKDNNKKIYEKWWFWVIIVVIIMGVFGGNTNTNTSNNQVPKENIETNVENNTNTSEQTSNEKVIFLKGSNGKEFYEILCDVADVEKKEGVKMGDTIDYASGNEKYGIELETNNNNEVNWISIYTLLPNNYENFFLAISRLEYSDSNKSECFNWIKDNLGKEASTKIGSANFKLYNGTSGSPILDVYTDGNEEFQKEQLNKIKNN